MARSTFYYHLSRLNKEDKYLFVRQRIKLIYHLHKGRYGYRRILSELRKEGIVINHKTVEKLMSEDGLKSKVRVKRYNSYKGERNIASDNLLKRNFSSYQPNKTWVTDITEFKIGNNKAYLSPVMDLFNREIVTYTISQRPVLSMVLKMINKAIRKRGKEDKLANVTSGDLILHSDQGWHYSHKDFRDILSKNGITQSMSRKGNCIDNAAMESFFGTLKSELLYLQKFKDIDHLIREIRKYIIYYNNSRIKINLNGMSPIKYKNQYLQNV